MTISKLILSNYKYLLASLVDSFDKSFLFSVRKDLTQLGFFIEYSLKAQPIALSIKNFSSLSVQGIFRLVFIIFAKRFVSVFSLNFLWWPMAILLSQKFGFWERFKIFLLKSLSLSVNLPIMPSILSIVSHLGRIFAKSIRLSKSQGDKRWLLAFNKSIPR